MTPERPPPGGGSFAPPPREGGEPFRILFLCTGNTCRSPLAEALARREILRRGWEQIEVRSAGVAALPGGPASEGSLRAGARHGLDLSGHRSAPLTAELLERADLVLAMSPGHLHALAGHPARERASLLTDFAEGREGGSGPESRGIPDPVGGGDLEYERTFLELEALVDRLLSRLEPLVSP